LWKEDALLAEVDRIEKLLLPHLATIQSNFPKKLEELRNFIRARSADLLAEISSDMPEWTKVPDHPPLIPSSLASGLKSDSIWNSAKNGDLEGIKAQLAKGVDVDAQDSLGSVPLALAALTGKAEAVKFLLQKGADIDARDKKNQTAMHSAAFLGQLEVIQVLIKNKADLNARNDEGETPLDVAAAPWSEELKGVIQFVGGLLQTKFDVERIQVARPKVAAFLRKMGAASGGDLPPPAPRSIWESVKVGNLDALKSQLAADGADANQPDPNGMTPLSWAALTGQLEAAELLLSAGADINATNRDGATALHSAAFLGHLPVVELLVSNKIKINAINGTGETSLNSVAAPWNDEIGGFLKLIAGLLKIEVDVDQVEASRPKIAAFLREHGGKTSAELK
jgi:ankyrin repeat protein